ncbi:MAG: D-alanyl-D-alanine carboxypeptidase [Ruminococcaceae bacterium]|nr:D-alanyl-D-alanine carboxypeptidase [Oscillospiraceae bacterium]
MHKQIIALLVAISTSISASVFPSTVSNDPPLPRGDITVSLANTVEGCPEPNAAAAYLCHYESGTELYAKNADAPLPMASTTKLMTALIVSELLPFNKVVTVDRRSVGIEGSSIYLYDGEKITVEALMYGLLLESANDAATALAIECAGSIEDFCVLMNRKSKELGLKSTNFTNPHGLDDDEHYTTARELSKIAAAALYDPQIAKIVASRSYKAPVMDKSTYRYMTNHNRLLSTYDGAVGMKTGFTKRTGRCLVSAASRNGMTLIAVTLNATDDWNAHRNMLDFGFSNYRVIKLIKPLDFDFPVDCIGGDAPTAELYSADSISVFIDQNFDTEKIKFEVRVNRPIFAPVEKDKIMGDVLVLYEKNQVASSTLRAKYNIEQRKDNRSFTEKIKDFFKELIS